MSGTTLTWPRRGTFVDRDVTDDQGQHPTFETSSDGYATVELDDADRVERYKDRGWVEGTPQDAGLTDPDDDNGGGDDADAASAAQQVDPDVFVQAFVAQSASDQADAIDAGEVDDYLDAIEAANEDGDDYATVQDAIDDRRDALNQG
jgi:hypothetical protein